MNGLYADTNCTALSENRSPRLIVAGLSIHKVVLRSFNCNEVIWRSHLRAFQTGPSASLD
ncbi:hypothetical protein C2E23DRAFT_458215 [Lenzites betulinus]|nr:hypothetical protein C2E23DRAFT_458215 [Lenzites betulinus]